MIRWLQNIFWQKPSVGLLDLLLLQKYNVTQKEKDLVAPYLKDGKTFYDIPWEIVEEYGKADVLATEEVALKQLDAFGTTFKELCYGTDFTTDVKAFA